MAFVAGGLLALMIQLNSQLASAGSPLLASWIAHGTGALTALLLWLFMGRRKAAPSPGGPEQNKQPKRTLPLWAWLGGLPGAMTVILAAICVNSPWGWAEPWHSCCWGSYCSAPSVILEAGGCCQSGNCIHSSGRHYCWYWPGRCC